MKKGALVFVIFIAGIFIFLLIYGGVKGSDSLREGSIEGWLWLFSLLIASILAVSFFISQHSKEVTIAASNYPSKEDYLSWKNLIFKPAFYGILAGILIMFLTFLVVWYFVYNGNSRDMVNETYFYFGNPFVYFIFSFLTLFIFLLLFIRYAPYLEKFTVRSRK